ncbi:class I SAM-dependent methyltransferase [Alphaproteobacteria bacterium KMM 3653]|uniref:Class I SAM-dependent methyltransferase n=1 Tax=Harenicola maris TaxID=2841044 RepID=A0AAP2CSZ0_9RHOB|nr:class I SAM-dependent methyltransferase [Harenicola maris]
MSSAKDFWDKKAEGYAKSAIADMPAYEYTLERTKSYLKPSDRVLEIGAGTGSTALLLAPGVADYTASDISSEMMRIGQQKAQAAEHDTSNLRFVTATPQDPALNTAPYDTLIALNLLHLIQDLPQLLSQLHAQIKPGGLLISKSPCLRGKLGLKFGAIRLALPLLHRLGVVPYVNIFSQQDLDRMITEAGFEIIETGNYPAHPPNRYIVAKRA